MKAARDEPYRLCTPLRSSIRCAIGGAALAAARPLFGAGALVGAAPDSRFADRVAMVLIRGPATSAASARRWCSCPRILLTAAHCLDGRCGIWRSIIATPRGCRRSFRSTRRSLTRATAPDAIQGPRRIDRPRADPHRTAARPALCRRRHRRRRAAPAIGAPRDRLRGYGAAREGDWPSGGDAASVTLAVREPASTVLEWAADPTGREAGACNGDSGAPVWSADGSDRDRDVALGPGDTWPGVRRPDPGPAARAAQGLDRGDERRLWGGG